MRGRYHYLMQRSGTLRSGWRLAALAALLTGMAVMGACPAQPTRQATGESNTPPDVPVIQRPMYIVTVKPLELILREVVGDRAGVSTLLKAGAGAHTFDPSPADVAAVAGAKGFFWIGEEYDDWAADFGSPASTQVLPLLPPEMLIDLAEHSERGGAGHDHSHGDQHGHETEHAHEDEHGNKDEHAHKDEHGHGNEHAEDGSQPDHAEHDEGEHGVVDPHFYTDPLLVRALLPKLAARLAELDPEGAAEYTRNAERFGTQLEQLDSELRTSLAAVAGQPVIMFHPSFNYFLKRYGLEYAGVVEAFPGKEPSPKYLQGIVRQVKDSGVKAIFSETLLPAAPADVIGEAAGVPVVELDPACGNSGRKYNDYADWLRYNAELFRQALQ